MRALASSAMAFSAAVFAANYILPLRFLKPCIVVFAGLFLLLLLSRRKWLRNVALFAVFFAFGLGYYGCFHSRTAAIAESFGGEARQIEAELIAYPEVYEDYCRLKVRVIDGAPAFKALVYDNNMDCTGLRPGERISFTGSVRPANTVYGESYDRYYSQGIYLKINSETRIELSAQGSRLPYLPLELSRFLTGRIDSLFPGDTAHFMRSLMLGVKTGLYEDEALHLAMSRAGLMHVVAVSGLHVAFMVSLLHSLMGSGRRSALCCILLVWLFVLVTGCSPSAVRAGFMQSLLLVAPILRRENDPPTSLSLILALILLENPFACASISLQLSFAAMAGILCFSGRIKLWLLRHMGRLGERAAGRYISANAANSLSVMVFTLPLTALDFGYIPLLSPITNLLALWAVSLCFSGGWLACALSLVPLLGKAAAWCCSLLARYIFLVAGAVSAVPEAVLYMENTALWLWLPVPYLLFIAFGFIRSKTLIKRGLPLLLSLVSLAFIHISLQREFANENTLALINVGQGQCAAAMAGENTVIIDCGNTSSLEDAGELAGRYLLSRGRDSIDAVVLSHLHEDHAKGLPMLMEMIRVERIILPASVWDSDSCLEDILLAAEKQGTEINYVNQDTKLSFGDISLSLYAPDAWERGNESCMMLSLDIAGYRAVFTGDADTEAERRLMDKLSPRKAEALIVGHHGSKYSSDEVFLRSLNGELALISVGYNHYGHPAEETLERLEDCGYNVYRTDMDGTVEIRITGR